MPSKNGSLPETLVLAMCSVSSRPWEGAADRPLYHNVFPDIVSNTVSEWQAAIQTTTATVPIRWSHVPLFQATC